MNQLVESCLRPLVDEGRIVLRLTRIVPLGLTALVFRRRWFLVFRLFPLDLSLELFLLLFGKAVGVNARQQSGVLKLSFAIGNEQPVVQV